jgi:hypothetical protein
MQGDVEVEMKKCRKMWSVSWYKNVNRKIGIGNSNIYLANRVLLEVEFMLQLFRRSQI